MNKFAAVIMLIAVGTGTRAQSPSPVTQTGRQALLEMFFSKIPGTSIKHLPEATRAALEKSGALASMQQYSLLAAQLQTQGKNFQTFESGKILLSAEDPQTRQKFEVFVENDSLKGDNDDIDLSFRQYKDGELQHTANFMPRLTFTMKMESGVWTLNSISVVIRLPLADPDFLKSITEKMKPQVTAQSVMQPALMPAVQNSFNSTPDPSVLAAMRTILSAETTYANTYKAIGYTCTLSDLDGFGAAEANEHQAMLINSGLAGGRKYGYVFALSACSGSPAASFHLTAVPIRNNFGQRAFCADQSGSIRSAADGNAATCLESGTPVQ